MDKKAQHMGHQIGGMDKEAQHMRHQFEDIDKEAQHMLHQIGSMDKEAQVHRILQALLQEQTTDQLHHCWNQHSILL
jgi:hypothetical protein